MNSLYENTKEKEIHIVVIGMAGNGKSTLCNTLIGQIDAFKESSNPECETLVTSGKSGKFDNFETFVIDTPGIGDPDKSDSDHLMKMIKYVKENPKVSLIILVLNTLIYRFTSNERRLLELFYNMAPGTPIHHHLAIVWTHSNPKILNELKIDINSRKKKFFEFIEKYIIQIPKEEIISIPQYFIDSIKARDKSSEDYKDLGALLAWAQNLKPIQKISVPLPKILDKNNNPIFILPNDKKIIELIGDIGLIDRKKEFTLIPEEIPINVKLIIKREIIEEPKEYNIFYLRLTTLNSDKKNEIHKIPLQKDKIAKVFGKNENEYYPLYFYSIEILESSNFFICHSLKPKITFIPFKGEYSFLLPDYFKLVSPSYIHIDWEEETDGKIFEIAHKKLSFSGVDYVFPGTFRNGPYKIEWEHNHKSKYSFGYIRYGNEKKLFKNIEYILLEEGKSITEGLWNQTHIKMPNKYLLGDGNIFISEKIVTKDNRPPKPYAPFSCNIWVDGTKTNGWNKGKPYEFRYHNKGDNIEKYRVYGKGWSLKRIDYASWGDSIQYKDAVGYNGPKSGYLSLIW